MRHVKTIWEKSVTQHSNACRSRDTLGQLPKTFWCGCWPQPTLPRATFVPGRRGTLPLGQLSMPSGDPGKWESATEQRRMVCYRAPPFPRRPSRPQFLGFTGHHPLCGDVEQDCSGEGWWENGLTWTACESGRAGSNQSRIRKLVGCDGWMPRIYLGSA